MKNKITLLIVEDDHNSAFLLKTILLKSGYHILDLVDNGEDAVKKSNEQQPDVVLMDINIQGKIDGIEAAHQIRKNSDIPVIYLSGANDQKTIDRAKETNPAGYILKPYTDKEVTISIEMALYKHKVDKELKEKEHCLSVTLSTLSEGIITTDDKKMITYMNPSAEVLTGIIKEKAIGKEVSQLFKNLYIKNSQEKIENIDTLLFSNSYTEQYQQPFELKNSVNQSRLVEIDSSPAMDTHGKIFNYVIAIRDVTQSFHSEEAMSMMATSLESIHDGVVITESEFKEGFPKIVYINKGAEIMTLYKKEHLINKTLDFIFGSHLPKNWRQLLEQCVKANYPLSEEVTITRQDGSSYVVFVSVSAVKNKANQSSNILFILRDVTKIKHLEENVWKAQKIEGIGRLAGGIAHDFNNLLSVINSYSDLLRIKLGDDYPYIKYIDNIRASGKKGADLVSQLMLFSRREAHSPKVISLADIVTETEQMLKRVIREDIQLKTNIEKDVYSIKADYSQMEQILMNLCVNAKDAMPAGGTIEISVCNKKITLNDEHKKINPKIPGNYVCLSVRDTGTGMDEETKKHIYEPFFTTKDVGKGTGLGLSTVYGIVKQSGGYIDLQSEMNQGTTFSIYFPAIMDQDATERPTPDALPEAAPRGSEKILIVEDDHTFADCISGILNLHGYIAHTVSDGQAALDQFEDKAHEIKLLITDLILPKLTGREVASRLTEKNPELKVIFMTGYDDQVDSFYEVPDKSVFLQKPFSLNTILNKARELLDSRESAAAL